MKGLILAAGNGSRMRGLTSGPKCLLPVGGESLLHRQIRALRSCGIRDIVVVTGYESDRVRVHCDRSIEFVFNPLYRSTNSLYSFWLSRGHLAGGFVVLNSDVLFHPALLRKLLLSRHKAALLMSPIDDARQSLGAEEMKVRTEGTLVRDISKDLDPGDADGENVGIVKFGASEAALLRTELERLVAEGALNDWAPRAFKCFAEQHPLHVVDTGNYPWIEIDVPEDYERAVQHVAPRMAL